MPSLDEVTMTTRFFNGPFGTLLSVASAMCGIVLPSTESLAAEWEKGPNQPDAEISRNADKLASSTPAASIKEARWGTPPSEYSLGAGGEVVPAEIGIDESSIGALRSSGGNADPAYEQDSFDGVPSSSNATVECGVSPATPDQITRLVVEAAHRHKVDAAFALAIATAESRLDQLRNSPKGARGPMQLMPETADRFGVSNVCDPAQNIDAGVRYLRELGEEFLNPLLIAAAYNAGEGRVRQYAGVPPFKETVRYVAEVVNIQLRLTGLSPGARENSVTTERSAQRVSGVIKAEQRRQWVGGVMHF
jgi:hypothetical protein